MNPLILDEQLLDDNRNYALASQSKRFANYVIDSIVFMVLLILLTIVYGLLGFDLDFLLDVNTIADRIITALLMAIYYIIFETALKGKTVGKYITKTRAVQIDGTPMTNAHIAKRSFSRIVPFDALSFLGSDPSKGWHDKWSETKVIDETVLIKPSTPQQPVTSAATTPQQPIISQEEE